MRFVSLGLLSLLLVGEELADARLRSREQQPLSSAVESCFLLHEVGAGEIRRDPSAACRARVTPASTFKVPHALAALDAGVVSGPDERIAFPGMADVPESWRRNHTLASAMRHSVVWYFQDIARRLGAERESAYLRKFAYGNMDATSGLTTFWLGGSLQIAPEEQLGFWIKLYADQLPASPRAMQQVRDMLVQPAGAVVNAAGEQSFAVPRLASATVSAKTGSGTDQSGRGVRWLAGHIRYSSRSFLFVSSVTGPRDLAPNAAIDLAARELERGMP